MIPNFKVMLTGSTLATSWKLTSKMFLLGEENDKTHNRYKQSLLLMSLSPVGFSVQGHRLLHCIVH